MITIITGVPGGGKTLYTVSEIISLQVEENKKLVAQGKEPRKIFVDGIPELQFEHEIAPDIMLWHEWAPDGALIVIDEVQRHWRPEAASKTPPPCIQALETHRHRGLDFIIITQHPNLIHTNVRRLVGRHIHLRRGHFGSGVYEWSECVNPDTSWKSAITKTKWDHPKKFFGTYKSASVHQKVKFRIPKAVWMLGISLILLITMVGYLGWYFYGNFTGRNIASSSGSESPAPAQSTNPMIVKNVPTVAQIQQQGQGVASNQPNNARYTNADRLRDDSQELVINDPQKAFKPRIQGFPETAVAYDTLRTVKSMPEITGCIADPDRCVCYSEQSTPLDMPEIQCRKNLQSIRYNPYRDAATRTVRNGA